jgi:hypothetical protein
LRIIDNVDHGAVNRLAKKYGVPKMTYKQLLERSYYSTSLKR